MTEQKSALRVDRRREVLHRRLVALQVARLRETYKDFLTSDRYEKLAGFFFQDVYSTVDKTERDRQFKDLYESFRRRLGERITRGVGEVVRLNDLSDALDARVAEVLEDLVDGARFGMEEYEEAYRRCDNYEERVRQIEMLCGSVRYFRTLAERRTIGLVLASVRAAASLFGGSAVIGFLNRAYRAYRSVTPEETEIFVRALRDRERERLDRIYGRA